MMSCFFCDSVKHLTQYCDVYTSIESKKEVASSKNCCPYCLNSVQHSSILSDICLLSSKCYICSTINHPTLLCPKTSLFPQLYIPKIDRNLLSRFLQILDFTEQYNLAFLSADSLHLVEKCFHLKQLKVLYKMEIFGTKNINHLDTYLNCNTITKNKIWFYSIDSSSEKLKNYFKHITLKIWIFRAKVVKLTFSKFFAHEFFSLLSIYTKELNCLRVAVTPEIKFSEIIRKVPNAINIELSQMTMEIEETWQDDLKKCLSEESYKAIMIKTDEFRFFGEDIV